jgi:O-antigen ligase
MKILNYLNVSELINEIKKNNLSTNIIFISSLMLPFSFFLGPATMEPLIFLICISYLYIILSKKEKIPFNTIIIFFLSFYIFLVFSSLLSNSILVSLKSSLLSIRFFVLTFAIIYISKKSNLFLKFFFISVFLCVSLMFISGLVQFFFDKNYYIVKLLTNTLPAKKTVVTGFFGEEKKLGSFIARLSPLIIGLYLFISNKEMKKKINIVLLYFAPLFLMGFFTGERTSMLYLSLTLFFLFILSIKNNKKNIYKLLIFLTIPFILFFSGINEFQLTVKNSYNQLFNEGKINYFSKQHETYAITSIELFKKNPFFGVGPNNYRRECGTIKLKYQENNCSTHPHNIFFQLVSETGGLGFFYYFIINLFIFYKIIKFLFAKKDGELELFLLLPIFYYLNPFFPSGNFFNNWYATIGLISLPFYIYLANKKYSAK